MISRQLTTKIWGLFFVGLTACFNVWLLVSHIPGVRMLVNQWTRTSTKDENSNFGSEISGI